MTTATLDTRSWLLWGLGCMLPLLLARNPWIALEIAIVVVTVRIVAVPPGPMARSGWLIRLAAVMAVVSATFNVLTVRSGDIVLLELPEEWPIIGGALTLNALGFGLVSGLTLFVLVLTGVTTASLIRWIDLFHILPRRLAPIAATGSVAWAFMPQTAIAWQNIRETMAMRGLRFRGPRDYLAIVIPLLANGLDRSLTMAEALEARGFGSPIGGEQAAGGGGTRAWSPVMLTGGLAGVAMSAYLLATNATRGGLLALLCAGVLLYVYVSLVPASSRDITRYRPHHLGVADRITLAAATVALLTTCLGIWWQPASMSLTFYPSLAWPDPVPFLLVGLAPLILPAFLIRPETDGPRR